MQHILHVAPFNLFSIVSAPIRMVLQSLSQSTVINGEANIKNILPLLQFCELILKLGSTISKSGRSTNEFR